MIKQSSPTLEQRIVSILAHANPGSETIMELLAEVEAAITLAELNIEAERAKAIDLVQTPDPKAAHERVVEAEIRRDQLRGVTPKLRSLLADRLSADATERWLADYRRVRQQLDEAVTLFETYPEHSQAIADMFARAVEIDREVSRVNGSAPDGEHRRLRSVELEARNLDRFTRDNPSLSATVQLRVWDNSGRKLWPLTSSGSLAAEFAQGMAAPYHPGNHWADADEQLRRRAEKEKHHHEIGEYYQRETEQQEERINAEERERFAASRRAT